MLGNKAQTLVIFVILLPIFILFIAYIYDFLNINYEKQKLNSITELVGKDSKETDYCDIVNKNDKDVTCYIGLDRVVLSKRVKSVFGLITNKKYFEIKVEIKK